jgi:hypothetical protein
VIGLFLKISSFETAWPNDPKLQKQELPVAAMIVNGSEQNEHSL